MRRPKPRTYLPHILDAPPALDRTGAARRGRPRSDHERVVIALRIDAELLDSIRAMAGRRRLPYQTYIHRLLSRAVAHDAALEPELTARPAAAKSRD